MISLLIIIVAEKIMKFEKKSLLKKFHLYFLYMWKNNVPCIENKKTNNIIHFQCVHQNASYEKQIAHVPIQFFPVFSHFFPILYAFFFLRYAMQCRREEALCFGSGCKSLNANKKESRRKKIYICSEREIFHKNSEQFFSCYRDHIRHCFCCCRCIRVY